MTKRQLKQLKEHITQNGGATLTPRGRITALKYGFMVSVAGYEKRTTLKRLNKRIINKYLKLARKADAFAGLWLDNNILYLDISKQYATKAQAIEAGLKNKQLAIYNNAEQTTIYL